MDGPHLPHITLIQIDPNSVVELLKNIKLLALTKFLQLTYSKKQTQ